ncbi:MAG: COX15/CtaA family protein [Usitatibacter sp.]
MSSTTAPPRSQRAIAAWLFACCALVFAMVLVGGVTRLTHSGLSIVEWQPIVGTLPPLGEAQWQEAFAKYRLTPEYRLRNHDMTLEGFKGIFWWEYSHRLLGRVIGFVFFVPFAWFAARRRIDRALAWPLAGIFLLGGLQGALGWYMVKSGLVDDPRVSSLRLASHLGLAFLIYGSMLWVALALWHPQTARASPRSRRLAGALAALVFAMVVTGALVAAIKAGYAYNTFPLMNGQWVPDEIWLIDPWWMNLVHNMATVQFNHRWLAAIVVGVSLAAWHGIGRDAAAAPRAKLLAHAMLGAVFVQVALGITTLLERAPVPLAALHQAGAVVVFTCAVALCQALVGAAGAQPPRTAASTATMKRSA